MLTESDTLERIADILDLLPGLTVHERAHIFHAIDTAPQPQSWAYVKGIDLSKGALRVPYTLAEATGWVALPTAGRILAGLNRAVGVIAP